MKIEVYISPEEDANMCGEALLHSMNKKDRWGYLTRDLDPSWEEVESNASLKILTLLKGCFACKEGNERVQQCLHKPTGTKAYLYWDGDGTLVFELPDGNTLENGDMKCSYGWTWNPTWVDNLPDNYYD